jgi:hypothetical protein
LRNNAKFRSRMNGNRLATSRAGAIKARGFHVMIPKVRFTTCRRRRGYRGNEAITGEINKEPQLVCVTVYDAVKPYSVREERMGTRPT